MSATVVRRAGGPSRLSAVIAIGVVVAGCGSAAGGSSTPSVAASSRSVPSAIAPTASRPAATPRPVPTPTPLPTAVDSTVDGVAVSTLKLGSSAAPVDVAFAFGSVWVANHHADTVTRIDPRTMSVQATIKAGAGPGWIVITDDAVWVSNQNGVGLTRIDPLTNRAETHSGAWAPCHQGIYARGSIWQPACDAHRILRIDPKTFASTDVSATVQGIVQTGDRLVVSGHQGLAELDPRTNALRPIGGPDAGWFLGFDGATIWASDERQVLRLRPEDGSVVATLAIPDAWAVAFVRRRAWVTSSAGLVEVDPVTSAIARTVGIGPSASVADGAGALWVTSYEANTLTRLMP